MKTQRPGTSLSLDDIPIPTAVFAPANGTPAWVRVEANAAFLEAFGTNPEIPQSLVALLDAMSRSRHAATLIGAVDGIWWEARAKLFGAVLAADSTVLVTFLDVTEYILSREKSERDQAAFQALLQYVPEGITVADGPDVTIRLISAHGLALTQRDEASLTGIGAPLHPDAWQVFHRDGVTRATAAELPLTRATTRGEVVQGEVWMLMRPDGSLLPILCNAGPIKDAGGSITGGVIAWRDITAILRAEEELIAALEARELLLKEMDHRLKNQLAMVEGLISTTARSSSTPADMARRLRGRVHALAQALEFVREGGISREQRLVHDLLAKVLVPFTQSYGGRIAIICYGKATLGISAASTLALMVHELATNAEKYGALSVETGRVRISCRRESEGRLTIRWEEIGGPSLSGDPPDHGFGSRLIRQAARQIGAEVSMNWDRPAGLVVQIAAPAARLAAN